MKSLFFKIFLFLVLVVGISCAQTIKLESSWQLLGTSVPIENTHTFNRECVDSVWTYDKGVWYYYKPGNELSNLKKIDKERGFWVQAKESCTFSSSDIVAPQNLDSSLDFEILSSWSETAVRKVLNLWAYGSFASEAQIKTWASMSPSLAIKEMLTFESSNPKISPPQEDALNNYPTFAQRSIFWSGSDLSNKTLSEHKKNFEFDNWSSPKSLWISSVNKRGLNPFLHKVGFFETNYHAVANQNAGVYPQALNTYYDAIISKLSLGVPYEEVLAEAASSGAIAYQYGHNRNIFKDGKFRGNEDFAREFHQLLFGILGEYDHDYHEFTTIRNTAKALTGIVVNWHSKEEGGPDVVPNYDISLHYPSTLEILKQNIKGDDAQKKLYNLSKIAINHQESLKNLPIIIARHFGDDNLNAQKIAKITYNWKKMETKNLLQFLRNYATSKMFHSEDRYKYLTSIDRNMLLLNKLTLNNDESYKHIYGHEWLLGDEEANPFRPIHDVFGHQTGLEASDSPLIFEVAYNRATKSSWWFSSNKKENENGDVIWEKDWSSKIPANGTSEYVVKDVALWLWEYIIGDGWKNYGALERAHLHALLSAGQDLGLFLDEENPTKIYSLKELQDDKLIVDKINDAGVAKIELLSIDDSKKRDANRRIGKAIAFISATPYIFLQEGK